MSESYIFHRRQHDDCTCNAPLYVLKYDQHYELQIKWLYLTVWCSGTWMHSLYTLYFAEHFNTAHEPYIKTRYRLYDLLKYLTLHIFKTSALREEEKEPFTFFSLSSHYCMSCTISWNFPNMWWTTFSLWLCVTLPWKADLWLMTFG